MSIKAMAWAWEQKLPCTEKMVLVCLGDMANMEENMCFPSQRYLADKCGLSRGCVNRIISKLVEKKLIRLVNRTRENGSKTSNCYYLCVDPQESPTVTSIVSGDDTCTSPTVTSITQIYKPKVNQDIYTPIFEEAWAHYPKRSGGNSQKAAFKAWSARLKQGATEADLLKATKGYNSYCCRSGKIGTEFVKQASTFYGPKEFWKEDWESMNVRPQRERAKYSAVEDTAKQLAREAEQRLASERRSEGYRGIGGAGIAISQDVADVRENSRGDTGSP